MKTRSLVVSSLVVASLIGVGLSSALAGQPLPPKAKFRGLTVAEWAVLQNEWSIGVGLGEGSEIPNPLKKVQLLPGSFGGGDFEFDVDVKKGTAIGASPWFAFGELYADGSSDDPEALAELIAFIFAERTVDVWLDGEIVMSGTLDELAAFTYEPTYFAEPVPYAEPQDRGPGFPPAVAAIWTVGIGAVFHPMTPGEHTLEVLTDGPFFGETYTRYNIFVE